MKHTERGHADISSLLPAKYNPRKISQHAKEGLKRSIDRFGLVQDIVVNKRNNVVVGGHQRLTVLKESGETSVPVVWVDLNDTDEKALNVTLNNPLISGEFDDSIAGLLTEIRDGIGVDEFAELNLDDLLSTEATAVVGNTDPDDVPEVPEEPITKPGDLWVLGDHRLLCGDSTNIQHVERLMGGKKADMVFTDPPYNVAFNGRSGKFDVIKNDNLNESDFDQFIVATVSTIRFLEPDAYYIWCNWKFYATLQTKLDFKGCIVWAKNVFGMGNGYRHQHEFCLYNATIDPSIKNESDLWHVSKDSSYVHPTQKPVHLSRRALGNHPKAEVIVDLFGGSGSTLIGCEQEGRHARLMELDPAYCDVIVKRWEDFTGKKAVRE